MQYGVPPRNLSVPIFLSKFLTDGMIHRLCRFSQIEKTPKLGLHLAQDESKIIDVGLWIGIEGANT